LYTIHTLGLPHGAERTALADFLLTPYNHEKALRMAAQHKTPTTPFDIVD
jgi:hypothetical protein